MRDHVSPISDTTVMSSAGAQSNHLNHVSTQMQYAAIVAGVCMVGYIIAALTKIWVADTGNQSTDPFGNPDGNEDRSF